MEKLDHSYIADENVKRPETLKNTLLIFFKVNIQISYDIAIACLEIYPREIKAYVRIKTYTNVHSSWNQPRSPSTGLLWVSNYGTAKPWNITQR